MPALRAAAGPRFVPSATGRIRGSAAASRAASAAEPSLEPSSTTSISQSAMLCACTEATVSARVAAAFQTGVITETRGSGGHHQVSISELACRRSR